MRATPSRPIHAMAKELTEAEAAVYDRQLRVWGLDTQQKCERQPARPARSSCSRAPQAERSACGGDWHDGRDCRGASVPRVRPLEQAAGTHRRSQLCKNIALAGVGRLTLMDDRKCDGQPSGNFLVPVDASASSRRAPAP